MSGGSSAVEPGCGAAALGLGITRRLGGFLAEFRPEDLPGTAVGDARRGGLTWRGRARAEGQVPRASGTVDTPMSDAAIEAKFLANAVPVIGEERAADVADMVSRPETLPGVRRLLASCA